MTFAEINITVREKVVLIWSKIRGREMVVEFKGVIFH